MLAGEAVVIARNKEPVVRLVREAPVKKRPLLGAMKGQFDIDESVFAPLDFTLLSITTEHAARAGKLPFPHGDPFDRLLIAQAQSEDMALVSNEKLFDGFGVERIW